MDKENISNPKRRIPIVVRRKPAPQTPDENQKLNILAQKKAKIIAEEMKGVVEIKATKKVKFTFPYRLKLERWIASMSQVELGNAIGESEYLIELFEAGAVRPTEEQIKDIAEVFGIKIKQLQPSKNK